MTDIAGMSESRDINEILAGLRKKALVLFFLIDTTGSMRGARIEAVNNAVRNVLFELRKCESENEGMEISVMLLEFSSEAQWRTSMPVPVSSFHYDDIKEPRGGANYGKAFKALDEFLSRKDFMGLDDIYAPVIVMITDGKPSDVSLYGEELRALHFNAWFSNAARSGIALEEGAESPECRRALVEFTKAESMVFLVKEMRKLEGQLRYAALTGIDTVTQQGVFRNERSGDMSLRSFSAESLFPMDETFGCDLPGLDEIDWEHDFPAYGGT